MRGGGLQAVIERWRTELAAGAASGLLGGVLFALAMQEQGMTVEVTGLAGFSSDGAELLAHLVLAVLGGAAFAAIVRYQPESHAATISLGVVFGLLLWIGGVLTLRPLLEGNAPTWSSEAASEAFPSLIGHILYGAVTGLGFHLLLLARRYVAPPPAAAPPVAAPTRVVILGGGFGGLATAQRLEQLYLRGASPEVTLVSRSNFLLFTPMLAEVASSALEAQHISASIRAACPRTRFRNAGVAAIDTEQREVRVLTGASAEPLTLPYDQLVIALGSEPNFFGLPGLEEHAFALKTLEDATRLRSQVLSSLELADTEADPEERRRLLSFVVAGGGFAGTETVAELLDFVHSARRYYPDLDRGEMRFALVHSGDRILPELSEELGEYASGKLEARGVEFILGKRVAGASADAVLLNDESELPTRTLVWTAGNQPNPRLMELPCERTPGGQLIVDETLRVQGLEGVWAVGDCAQVPDPDEPGRFYPPTAQHALREGKAVAENVAATLRGQPPKPFRFHAIGSLVALGRRTAAAEIRGRQFSGLLAWMMWRTIYLSKLPGLEKKVRVSLDWSIELFFPRDIVLTSEVAPPSAHRIEERAPPVRDGGEDGEDGDAS